MMPDVFTVAKRKRIMSNIKGHNTKPEKIVRRCLRKLGSCFKTYSKDLPGNPDIVLQHLKKVIFVHGCFWHGHKRCHRADLPETNRTFWRKKIKGNTLRDEKVKRMLRRLGWKTLTVWQCQIKDLERLTERLNDFIKKE